MVRVTATLHDDAEHLLHLVGDPLDGVVQTWGERRVGGLLRQGGGLQRAVRLDTRDAALVSVCDGELTARQSLVAISGLLERPTDEALAAGATLIRGLAGDGFLLPG